ncbi:mannose-1-phosphate guanylyltransferase [Candidatus Falkowbacteria bacterium]|nr:mannose-1-phosphate guanylyltransferase [Candidatus Falkowbacteria bacterium]
MKIVIFAGGTGSRLWPLSRKSRPKQFIKLTNEKTPLENTLERFLNDYSMDDIYISTDPANEKIIKEILPDFPLENIIIEPEKRDNAPAMGFVALVLSLKFPDEPFAFIPTDSHIENPQRFIECLKVAEKLIIDTGKMLDIGIEAELPSTTLGYTKIGDKYKTINDVEVYHFAGQTEKPDLATAKKYLKTGDYLWHANHYMWTPRLLLEAYEKYAPEHNKHLFNIYEALLEGDEEKVKQEYSKMEKISIDYAITEKMDPSEVLIIKGDFGWSDIGAFDILYDKLKEQADKDGNVVKANHTGVDTKNCLIFGQENKKIATIGLSDLAIIDTPDTLLICPKEKSQDVKKIVEKLKDEGEDKYL